MQYTTSQSLLDLVTFGGIGHVTGTTIEFDNITALDGYNIDNFTINPDGTITVHGGTEPGEYVFSYTLCPTGSTTGCADVTCTITINTTVRANADVFTFQTTGATVPSQTYNIFTNDQYSPDCFLAVPNNWVSASGNVTLSSYDMSSFPPGNLLQFNNGIFSTLATISNPIPVGIYPFSYTICDVNQPTICSTANGWIEVLGFASKMTNATMLPNEVDFNAISIQPNPSTGIFHLNFNNYLQEKTTIAVYNLLSQKILEDEIINTNSYELYLNNLSSGTYLLKIYDGNQSVEKKIIKQ
jgi:hypothetical protein